MIEENELWSVHDSSKIQSYLTCERKHFFEYVLCWKPAVPSIHLEFGTAWHKAKEVLMLRGYSDRTKDSEIVAEAFDAFMNYHAQALSPMDIENSGPKTPENALRALEQYVRYYRNDRFKLLFSEVSGSVPINVGRQIYFKIDSIIEDEHSLVAILEHKTGSRFSSLWAAEWRQKHQIFVYTHLLHSLYDSQKVYGVIVNGVFFSNPPKTRKDGKPYANSRDNEFHRVHCRKTPEQMDAWLVEINDIVAQIESSYRKLKWDLHNKVMRSFPKRTESCTKYGICPYIDFCSSWSNPLHHADEVPDCFQYEAWDPRNIPETKPLKWSDV